jgi:hypothetical protein
MMGLRQSLDHRRTDQVQIIAKVLERGMLMRKGIGFMLITSSCDTDHGQVSGWAIGVIAHCAVPGTPAGAWAAQHGAIHVSCGETCGQTQYADAMTMMKDKRVARDRMPS